MKRLPFFFAGSDKESTIAFVILASQLIDGVIDHHSPVHEIHSWRKVQANWHFPKCSLPYPNSFFVVMT